jgi:hypothetical protein
LFGSFCVAFCRVFGRLNGHQHCCTNLIFAVFRFLNSHGITGNPKRSITAKTCAITAAQRLREGRLAVRIFGVRDTSIARDHHEQYFISLTKGLAHPNRRRNVRLSLPPGGETKTVHNEHENNPSAKQHEKTMTMYKELPT